MGLRELLGLDVVGASLESFVAVVLSRVPSSSRERAPGFGWRGVTESLHKMTVEFGRVRVGWQRRERAGGPFQHVVDQRWVAHKQWAVEIGGEQAIANVTVRDSA